MPTTWPRLILGSSSPYRRELLARLRLPFDTCSPDIDETPGDGEHPEMLAARLARGKALAVAQQWRDDVVVIGSDQVADLDGEAIGKPGDHAGATAQLRRMRGHTVRFHTAVCVLRPATGYAGYAMQSVVVRFRELSDAEIETYLRLEQPYDCAGSAKCETLGIALLDAIESLDPTALVGLPLIDTARLLHEAGLDPLMYAAGQESTPQ